MKRLAEIKARLEQIQKEIRDGNVTKELNDEVDRLIEEKKKIELELERSKKAFESFDTIHHEHDTHDREGEDADKVYRVAWLKHFSKKRMSQAENDIIQRAMTTDSTSGGAAIPTITAKRIIDALERTAVLFPRTFKMYIPGNVTLPKEDASADAAWSSEGTAATPGTDKLTAITFGAYDLIKVQSITAKLEAMSIDDFENWLVRMLARKMYKALDKSIISGAGSLSNQPEGILSGITWVKTTGATQNAVEIANAGSITYANVLTLLGLLKSDYVQNAELIMTRKTLFNQIYNIKDSNNNPIFIMNRETGNSGKLLGVPVTIFDNMDDNTILYGDLSFFTFNFNKDIELAFDKSVGFASASTMYRAHSLVDGKVTDTNSFVKLYEAAA